MAHARCTSSSCMVYEREAGWLRFAVWLFSTGSRRACKETVHALEWGTGRECAMACLGRRNALQYICLKLLSHMLLLLAALRQHHPRLRKHLLTYRL